MPLKPLSSDAETIAQQFKEFAYIVSHDLSTPARGMVEFSRILKDEEADGLSADAKEYLALIIECGEKLQKMMVGLLDYSRLNTMKKPFTKVNSAAVLNDCRIVLKETIQTSQGTLETAPMPIVLADAEQLMQLLLILLQNAFLFHPAGVTPSVTIHAETVGDDWQFTVRDNGIGIGPEFHERIFQPFQRLHTESEYPGIGMGLALAKKIVERHGGRLWVESALGEGAAFVFTIPGTERAQ